MATDTLLAAMEQSASLRRTLNRFFQAMIVQTSQTAVANRLGKLEERLGRWLLMASDRTDGPVLALTHEFLATMLGVQRPAVTAAIHELEASGLIRAERSHIQVTDRAGVIKFVGGLYGVPEREYERLMGGALNQTGANQRPS
jgi:CRP-like cAMP-binding protein